MLFNESIGAPAWVSFLFVSGQSLSHTGPEKGGPQSLENNMYFPSDWRVVARYHSVKSAIIRVLHQLQLNLYSTFHYM